MGQMYLGFNTQGFSIVVVDAIKSSKKVQVSPESSDMKLNLVLINSIL